MKTSGWGGVKVTINVGISIKDRGTGALLPAESTNASSLQSVQGGPGKQQASY